jgi:glycosyltransferase involved in cell wall biosynthesis
MALGAWRTVKRVLRSHGADVLDAHYLYPDGVAAALIARLVRRPFVMTARGSDVNLLPRYAVPRRLIRWATGAAARVITVSEALRTALTALGVEAGKVVTLRNGVDGSEFRAREYAACRRRLDLPDTTVLLSVGTLIEAKGHRLLIDALVRLPRAFAVIVGEGPDARVLVERATSSGVADRVRFTGPLDRDALIDYYSAADYLVLASAREGMPNVVLEAASCGLRVIATNCGGIGEVIRSSEQGVLMSERSADAIARAVSGGESGVRAPHRDDVSWGPTIAAQIQLYRSLLAEGAPS